MTAVAERPIELPAQAPAKPRSLAPKEHGAYGQLLLPLVAACASAVPTAASLALTGASVAAFFAHEPLLLLLGQRGKRAVREHGARSRRQLVILGGVALVLGAAGLWLAPNAARLSALLPFGLGLALIGFLVRNEEKSTPGELTAAAALPAAAVPVALAAGLSAELAYGAWLCWSIGFCAATWAIRNIIARKKGRPMSLPVALAALGVAVAAAVAFVGHHAALPALPMLLLAAVIVITRPEPTQLRRVGWGMVSASVLTAVMVLVGVHI